MQVPASLDKTACKGSSVAAQGTVICNLRLTSRISKFRFPLDQVGSKQKNMYSTVTLLATVFFFFSSGCMGLVWLVKCMPNYNLVPTICFQLS